jgi:hypothetical protein
LPDAYRLDAELEAEKTAKFARLVEGGYCIKPDHGVVASMTATDYFNYCRIAYLAGKRPDETVAESWTGRKMYEHFADGRHDGLLDIDPESPQEFADWIDGNHPKKGSGGHPWEIKRGGNTTHIDLMVYRPSHFVKAGFKIELRAGAIHRMAEMIRMFLALHEAGLPISVSNPEGVRKRLLALDNIGIVPAYAPLHRANQQFAVADEVFDVMHYDELGRYKRRAAPFITWKPLPLLCPRKLRLPTLQD